MLSRLLGNSTRVLPGREATTEEPQSGSASSDEIDLVGDQIPEMSDKKSKLQWWDTWALGVSTAIGGHFFLWEICYLAGFGHYIIAYFLIASAYGMLALCMAELTSALPFAGGAYGIARVTLGTLPGFMIGCFDAYQSIFNAAYSIAAMGAVISFVSGADRKWEPLWWIIIHSSYMIITIVGGPWMWRTIKLLSFSSVVLILIYILGSIKFADFEENAPLWLPFGVEGHDRWFQGGARLFFRIIPVPCWFFAGTESINLACHDCENPKRDVPRGYLLTFATIFCTSLATIFIGASVPPGATLLPYFPLPTAVAYMRIFDLNLQRATALSLPAIYTSGLGFTYYYGSQLRAMGKSGLVHPWLGYDIPGFKTPVVALLFGMVVAMLVALRYYWWDPLPDENLLSISVLGAGFIYCSQFVSFIVFRGYYSSIKREFSSPLGIAGAVYGLLVFLIMVAVIVGINQDPAKIYLAVYFSLLVLYYYLVVRHRQVFSEEEKTVLFKAYLMKSNRSRNVRLRTGAMRASFMRAASAEDVQVAQSVRYKPSPHTGSSDGSYTGSGSGERGGAGAGARAELSTGRVVLSEEPSNSARSRPSFRASASMSAIEERTVRLAGEDPQGDYGGGGGDGDVEQEQGVEMRGISSIPEGSG